MKAKAKKVLIALDCGSMTLEIAEQGYSIAKTMDANLVLLNVIEDSICYSSSEHFTVTGFATNSNRIPHSENSFEDSIDSAKQCLEKTKRHLGSKNIETMVKEGDFAETILLTAQELDVELIIMGLKSQESLDKLCLGFVTEKVLKLTSFATLIIPSKIKNNNN